MKWFKKEPIPVPEMKVGDLLARVYELHPDRKYVVWFEQMLNPQHIETLRKHMASMIGKGQVTFVAGISAPHIYEFEDKKLCKFCELDPCICQSIIEGGES
jgi:hypothetical protein